jgi:hypothetical protein
VLVESRLRRPMMVIRIDRLVSGNRGRLADDVLYLATIAFIFAIVLGIVG